MGLEPIHHLSKTCCEERKNQFQSQRKTTIDRILNESDDEDKNVQVKTFNCHQSRKMLRGPMSFVSKSQRLDDVDPLYGFNAVATFGPCIAGQQNLKKSPNNGLISNLHSNKPKSVRKQVRFSDRLICRQFSRSEEELISNEEKLHKKILRKLAFSRPQKKAIKDCSANFQLTWYMESEYSLSFVSGLYPEEIAALNSSNQKRDGFVAKHNLTDLPIPEEDESDELSIYSTDSFTVYENSLSSESTEACEKNTSYDTIPSHSSDSGYERSHSSSLNNIKDKWITCEEAARTATDELSLIDNLYNRAQSDAERNIAQSLSKMNIPEWALRGIKLSDKDGSIMTRSNDTSQVPTPSMRSPLSYSYRDLWASRTYNHFENL